MTEDRGQRTEDRGRCRSGQWLEFGGGVISSLVQQAIPAYAGGDHAMTHSTTTDQPQRQTETASYLFDNWFDPIEANLRDRAREFLQAMLEAELEVALGRSRYARRRMRASGDFGGDSERYWSPARPSPAHAAGDLRAAEVRGAPRSARYFGRQNHRVEKPHAGSLSASHARGRRADRRLLSFRHQHPPRAPCARYAVQGCGR